MIFKGCRKRPSDPLDSPVLLFNDFGDSITSRDLEGGGVSIMADSGGGKSSSLIPTLGIALLRSGASITASTDLPPLN